MEEYAVRRGRINSPTVTAITEGVEAAEGTADAGVLVLFVEFGVVAAEGQHCHCLKCLWGWLRLGAFFF